MDTHSRADEEAALLDKRLQLTLLFDFYGELLTYKQRMVYEMYYQNDLSLSEIGEELHISRQAVQDQLKRSENILEGYESKLRLLERFLEHQKSVKAIMEILDTLEESESQLPASWIYSIEKVKKIAGEMLK